MRLQESLKTMDSKIKFSQVSAHRRSCYRLGQVPNKYAALNSGSKILFLTCQVDVHKNNLAVSVMGWTKDACCYVIDYWLCAGLDTEGDDFTEVSSSAWVWLREFIKNKEYISDDGSKYKVAIVLIDAGYLKGTVVDFCSDYDVGVYPVLGRHSGPRNQKIKEFDGFETSLGTTGYKILVDHYKDRIAPVLRREWIEESGMQKPFHFNTPTDITDKQLKELTAEVRLMKKDERDNASYYWSRFGGNNNLWDLLVYGHAAFEILAHSICVKELNLDVVDWNKFYEHLEKEKIFFDDAGDSVK